MKRNVLWPTAAEYDVPGPAPHGHDVHGGHGLLAGHGRSADADVRAGGSSVHARRRWRWRRRRWRRLRLPARHGPAHRLPAGDQLPVHPQQRRGGHHRHAGLSHPQHHPLLGLFRQNHLAARRHVRRAPGRAQGHHPRHPRGPVEGNDHPRHLVDTYSTFQTFFGFYVQIIVKKSVFGVSGLNFQVFRLELVSE